MNLFVFGLGYSVRQFLKLHGARFTEISGTVRSPEKAKAMEEEGLDTFVFDGTDHDPRILDRIARADALLVSIPPASETDPVLAHFSQAIASAPSLRWIGYLSTVGVYGHADGNWVDETTPPNPATARSRQRIAAEQAWLALGERASFAVQIFRLAGIYGPGRNALVKVADGTAKRIVKPGQVFNRIHTADIAQVLMASMERPSRNAVYNVADDEPGPPQDVIAHAAELLGREPPPEVPFDEADQTPMARAFYADNKRVRNTRIKTELGVALRYPTYREGLRALLDSGDGIRQEH
ncbi:SDR family oxidoreductase [Microvirga lotononidis]|uniref:RmlD-like substrate binding protein n=1 Tax=Microvirga lotononidis TaxID=864069 RepID=I4YL41_9HYPH|nr:SDR family oxidoreductase [Microvirga lotononidis]EIM24683.1 RmlD-like substrate binding protein [Microvirga lotononidis]WQO26694.1 SDR family oxidoreductase [Microvirga lotononidis]